MPFWQVHTPVQQLQPFERGRIVGLWETGWTYRLIAADVRHNVSLLQQCLWDIPTPVDQVLDSHVVQMHMKINILCEQW